MLIRLLICITLGFLLATNSLWPSQAESSIHLAFFKTIYVNGSYTGAIEDGSIAQPFKTITKAIAAAADGDTIVIQAGVYPETPLFNKRVLVQATGGAVTIIPGQVRNENLRLGFDLTHGITLTSIFDPVTGREYLTRPTFFFEFAVNNGTPYQSNNGVVVDDFSLMADGSQWVINAHATNEPLAFALTISAGRGDTAAVLRMRVTNISRDRIFLRTVMPKIRGLTTDGMMGAVPQEIGSVAPLRASDNCTTPRRSNCTDGFVKSENDCTLGMSFDICVGLPTSMNSMEVASIYDPTGRGGVFFADIDGDLKNGISPIQFNLSAAEVAGFWITDLPSFQTVQMPRLAIGVHHDGDWHRAVDYYVSQHAARLKFPTIPTWFRDQGAIYSFAGGGAGGVYLAHGDIGMGRGLKDVISSFDELPKLLGEAQQLGTNIVYLWDYWEKDASGLDAPYFNKGDYIPRDDLRGAEVSGAEALKKGIAKVHLQGGKVIMYVEPFIIYAFSQLAVQKGTAWAGRDAAGNIYKHYSAALTMVAPFVPWQDKVVEIAQRLVGQYGADGILLDSWAWQMNWPMQNQQEKRLYSPKEYSQGVLTLASRVRAAIQGINPITPDAIVIGETTAGPISQHWDGGISADFAWLRYRNRGRIIASPVRYGLPQVNFISNGTTLNELNQIYAAGHNLALCCNWGRDKGDNFINLNAAYIKNLVNIRQTYKDALIYGQQSYQPATTNSDVIAYLYQGTQNTVMTMVNISEASLLVGVTLRSSESNVTWKDLLTGETFSARGEPQMLISVPGNGLRVLLKQR